MSRFFFSSTITDNSKVVNSTLLNFYSFILPLRNMDTSSSYIIDNTELKTLILASIQTLKRNNKKCGTEEVFQLVLESLDSDIDKESFDKIL